MGQVGRSGSYARKVGQVGRSGMVWFGLVWKAQIQNTQYVTTVNECGAVSDSFILDNLRLGHHGMVTTTAYNL